MLETKGNVTFTATGRNKARTWNAKIEEGLLSPSMVDSFHARAVAEGYDGKYDARLHPDDYDKWDLLFGTDDLFVSVS